MTNSNVGSIRTDRSWASILNQLATQLRLWGIRDYILPKAADARHAGGAVTLELVGKDGQWHELICNRFIDGNRAERNLLALTIAIEGYRKAEQRGIAGLFVEIAKFAALPDPNNPHHILGVDEHASVSTMREAYHGRVKTAHPDHGGTREEFDRVREAGKKLGVA